MHYIGFNRENSNSSSNINDTIQFAISSYLKNCGYWHVKGAFDISGYKDETKIINKDIYIFITKEYRYIFIFDYNMDRICSVNVINEKVSIDFNYIYFNSNEMLYMRKLLNEYNIHNKSEEIKNLLEIALVSKYLSNDIVTENNLKLKKNKWKIIKPPNYDIDKIIKSVESKKIIEYEYSLLLDKVYNNANSFMFFSNDLENIYLVSLDAKKIKYINLKEESLTIKKDYVNLTDDEVEYIEYLIETTLLKAYFYLEVALITKVFDGEMIYLVHKDEIPENSSYYKVTPFYYYEMI